MVCNATGTQENYSIAGDYVVWQDSRSGTANIWAYQFSTKSEFQVSFSDTQAINPSTDGTHVVWADHRDDMQSVYALDLGNGSEFAITDYESKAREPKVREGVVIWLDAYLGGVDLMITEDLGSTITNVTSTESSLIHSMDDYLLLLIGDGLWQRERLPAFDAADAAGVSILGIGTGTTGTSLAIALADAGRFGISHSYESYNGYVMGIDVLETSHAIFAGLDTSVTVALGDDYGTEDEQTFWSSGVDKPSDWTILAIFGDDMYLYDEPAIVEFTTPLGTTVILDGSANTYDGHDYWNADHWSLFTNTVNYLMEQ
ncbi:MAG: hypothetical protein HN348_25425 [Proteobacteria bacterium]|nr:hypothetical protein [Pseudomonadota bacterium]